MTLPIKPNYSVQNPGIDNRQPPMYSQRAPAYTPYSNQDQPMNSYQNQQAQPPIAKAPLIPAKNKKPIHTAFFSNIPFDIPFQKFEEFVREYGEIANVYSLIDKKGIAFVTYFDLRNAQKAVDLANGKYLEGRVIRTNYANKQYFPNRDPRNTCAAVIIRSDMNPSHVTIHDILNAMKEFGEIEQTTVPEGTTGQFIVRYWDLRAAQAAIEATNSQLCIKGEHLNLDFLIEDADNSNNSYNNNPTNNSYDQRQQNPYNHQPPYQQNNYGMQYEQPPMPNYGGQADRPYPPSGQPQPNYGQPAYQQPPIPNQPSQADRKNNAQLLHKLKSLLKQNQ